MFGPIEKCRLSLIIGLATILAPLPTYAGNGGGYSGPNMAPDSIPIQLDRGIRAKLVEDAIDVCFALGDANSGTVSLMQRLAEQARFGGAPTHGIGDQTVKNPVYEATAWMDVNNKMLMARGRMGGDIGNGAGQPLMSYSQLVDYSPKFRYSAQEGLEFVPGFRGGLNENWILVSGVHLVSPSGLPTVHFDSISQDGGYDEFGRPDSNENILLGVSVKLPKDYGPTVAMYNPESKHSSKITLNLVEYVECLKGQIQKKAASQ